MKNTPPFKHSHLFKLAFGLTIIPSYGAFYWDDLTYSIDNGASQMLSYDGASLDTLSLGMGSEIIGSFDAVTAGDITTVNFRYTFTGGTGDFRVSEHPNPSNLPGFYRLEVAPLADIIDSSTASALDFSFDFVQPIQGSLNLRNNVAGMFVLGLDSDSTLDYTVADDSLQSIVLNDGDLYRTINVGTTNFQNPSSYSTGGTTAFLDVNAGENEGLGWANAGGSTLTQNVGSIFGSISTDGANDEFGTGALFLTTFNGTFENTNGLLVVPEPSTLAIASLGLLGLFRRRRS